MEEGKKEDRGKGVDQIPLREFLLHYHEADAYVVASIPEVMRRKTTSWSPPSVDMYSVVSVSTRRCIGFILPDLWRSCQSYS